VHVDWGDVPAWLGLIGAAFAFAVALDQYRTAQAWKRAEFVAAETKLFFEHPQVATALLLIDYSVIRLDKVGKRSVQGTVFDDDLLIRALAVHTQFTDEIEKFNDAEMLARTAFDELLTGLERLDHYLQTNLISVGDLKVYLGYWVEKLGDPESRWKKPEFYQALYGFIEAYRYQGVRHLFESFGLSGRPAPST
jgi:hypothetical protein